eukprot:g4036.t1
MTEPEKVDAFLRRRILQCLAIPPYIDDESDYQPNTKVSDTKINASPCSYPVLLQLFDKKNDHPSSPSKDHLVSTLSKKKKDRRQRRRRKPKKNESQELAEATTTVQIPEDVSEASAFLDCILTTVSEKLNSLNENGPDDSIDEDDLQDIFAYPVQMFYMSRNQNVGLNDITKVVKDLIKVTKNNIICDSENDEEKENTHNLNTEKKAIDQLREIIGKDVEEEQGLDLQKILDDANGNLQIAVLNILDRQNLIQEVQTQQPTRSRQRKQQKHGTKSKTNSNRRKKGRNERKQYTETNRQSSSILTVASFQQNNHQCFSGEEEEEDSEGEEEEESADFAEKLEALRRQRALLQRYDEVIDHRSEEMSLHKKALRKKKERESKLGRGGKSGGGTNGLFDGKKKKKKKKMVTRYVEGKKVQVREGEKYTIEKIGEEWDGGSRGRIKSKKKGGVGWYSG